ncbi:MAG: hypothetical protein IT355_06720 [Gemmatimonadaceae bacterium]|nr:hypothetical protein [Gemmatimonadaceae bacterium]
MAALLDVRGALAAELQRLVRDAAEWPLRDRRRFRNLLLDATSSDAMPLVELLLRAHDDGLLRSFPARTAPRAAWDTATARLASDLQTQRFVEPGVARFVAESWARALGPVMVTPTPAPSARAAAPAPRGPVRSSANLPPRPWTAAPAASAAPQAPSPAQVKAYRQQNMVFVVVLVAITALTIVAIRSGSSRGDDTPGATASRTVPSAATPRAPARTAPAPAPAPSPPVAATRASPDSTPPAVDTARTAPPRPDSMPRVGRAPVPVAAARERASDDIVLNAGRVFEGRVLSVRELSITVKDDETGLEFEIPKSDIERIVTRDGRTMRFGGDNVPLIGTDDDVAAASHGGRYRVRYTERWGTERSECKDVARRFAPGTDLLVQHLRGAPMLRLAFLGGQGFNAAVRADGLFATVADVAPVRGPQGSAVTARLSGRISRAGVLAGIARLTAVAPDGQVVCDLALTMDGAILP